ncbi:hypothetical protein HDU86_003707 [Geranomyces michiganensis]|nr:hypothetical protein HDU86_003707 [Geranomyces michiganensis]
MMKTASGRRAGDTTPTQLAPALDLSTVDPPFAPPGPPPDDASVQRHFGIAQAPTFRPTAAEFRDPMRYIESIRLIGEAHGICKIIPPTGWSPDFALDTERFWFRPRLMRINSMEANSRVILNYLDQLQKFHRQQGTQFTRVPIFHKEHINLFELKKEVLRRGGYERVRAIKEWAQVGAAIGLPVKNLQALAVSVKNAYVKWILPYETFMARHGPAGSRHPLPPPSNGSDDDEDVQAEGTSTRSKKRAQARASAAASGTENGSTSSSPVKPAIVPPKPGTELCEICGGGQDDDKMLLCDGCDRGYHLYCFDPPMSAIPDTDWYCPDCLRSSGDDYGFEEGELRNLRSFQKVANDFKEKHFRKQLGTEDGQNVIVTEKEVEEEFWRLVESPYEDVEVEYGADLRSSQKGSGFPSKEEDPKNPYATSGWNLNNMPTLPESLFCNIRNDISGMTIPWLYIGMVFSTFCWHTEDHYTYSINYLHWGETKTWYGIPASHANGFEDTMMKHVPELFEGNADLLFHLTTMLSPDLLMKNGVNVVGCDQRPGEFVITFPRAYHAGFNQGVSERSPLFDPFQIINSTLSFGAGGLQFNFAEAVNFALPNWLPYGQECVERLQFYRKQPVFCHDELILATSQRGIDARGASWLKEALENLCERELAARHAVRSEHPGIGEVVENVEISEEEHDQCSACHQYCFMSALKCGRCRNGKMVCFEHEYEVRGNVIFSLLRFLLVMLTGMFRRAQLCECRYPRLIMSIRFTDFELTQFVVHASSISSEPTEWKVKYNTLLAQHRRPPLKDLQYLLEASESIPEPIKEAMLLREYLEKVNLWVGKAQKVLIKRERTTSGNGFTGNLLEELGDIAGETSLTHIEALLSEADMLAFSAPEIQSLEELARVVYELRAEAKAMTESPAVSPVKVNGTLDSAAFKLNGKSPSTKQAQREWTLLAEKTLSSPAPGEQADIVDIIEAGKAVGVEADHPLMLRLKPLALEQAEQEWLALARGTLSFASVTALDDVLEVIDVGKTLGIPNDHPVMQRLKRTKKDGFEWKVLAAGLLKQRSIDYKELLEVEAAKSRVPVVPELWERIEELCANCAEWREKARAVLDSPGELRRPASELNELLDEIRDLPVRPDEAQILANDRARLADWRSRAQRTLQIKSPNFCNDFLESVRACTAREEDQPGVFCICRSGIEEGLMIECEVCSCWYHANCVGLNKKMIKSEYVYKCPVCDLFSLKERNRSSRRPTVYQVTLLAKQASEIPRWTVDGALQLAMGAELVCDWDDFVSATLLNRGTSVAELKHLLRCCEGMPVDVEDKACRLRDRLRVLYFESQKPVPPHVRGVAGLPPSYGSSRLGGPPRPPPPPPPPSAKWKSITPAEDDESCGRGKRQKHATPASEALAEAREAKSAKRKPSIDHPHRQSVAGSHVDPAATSVPLLKRQKQAEPGDEDDKSVRPPAVSAPGPAAVRSNPPRAPSASIVKEGSPVFVAPPLAPTTPGPPPVVPSPAISPVGRGTTPPPPSPQPFDPFTLAQNFVITPFSP